MKFRSNIIIIHPNWQDSWAVGDDRYEAQYQGYDGEVSIDISDDGGLTWEHIMNYTPQGPASMHSCNVMIDGSPSDRARLRITAVADPSRVGVSDFFSTPA